MEIKAITEIKTEEEARQMAIDFQFWSSEQNLSYAELSLWGGFFEKLGVKFNLTDEFKEEGII